MHGQQDEPFLVVFESRYRKFIYQVTLLDLLHHQATALVFVGLQRPDHGLGVGVDALWLEQHLTAELQLPHHAGTGQQTDHRLQLLMLELPVLLGQP